MLSDEDIRRIADIFDDRLAKSKLATEVAKLATEVTKLATEVTSIKGDVATIKTTVAKQGDAIKQIQNFLQIESSGIEEEINQTVRRFLTQRFQGYKLKELEIKNIKSPFSKDFITEFDGIFVASPKLESATASYLVIVEAKHYVSFERINRKLEQIHFLKDYIRCAKMFHEGNTDPRGNWTQQFKATVNQYKLYNIEHIYLYVGGPVWEKGTVTYIDKINTNIGQLTRFDRKHEPSRPKITIDDEQNVLEYLKTYVKAIVPQGARYVVKDADVLRSEGGGKCTTKGIQMRILPNHMNTIFT